MLGLMVMPVLYGPAMVGFVAYLLHGRPSFSLGGSSARSVFPLPLTIFHLNIDLNGRHCPKWRKDVVQVPAMPTYSLSSSLELLSQDRIEFKMDLRIGPQDSNIQLSLLCPLSDSLNLYGFWTTSGIEGFWI